MKETFNKKDTSIIKGIAIILLLFHHCFLRPKRYKGFNIVFAPFTQAQYTYIASFLRICVGMFVFLTAYGITVSIKNKYKTLDITGAQIREYTKRRYFKLYSGWFFTFLFCEIMLMVLSQKPLLKYGKGFRAIIYFIVDGLGLSQFFQTPQLIGAWWYMGLAFMLIICIPFFIKLYKKMGAVYLIAIFAIVYRQFALPAYYSTTLTRWVPAALLGIICADKNILEKMRSFQLIKGSSVVNKLVKFVLSLIILSILVKFRASDISETFMEIKDGFIPFFIIYFCYEFINNIKGLNTILAFIGKYSMSIYLVHSPVRLDYCRNLVYGVRYPFLVVLVLLLISLAIALLIEQLIKWTRYDKLVSYLRTRFIQ